MGCVLEFGVPRNTCVTCPGSFRKLTKGNNFKKILMPELWILCMALDPLKLYPRMKFHFNSISWTWVIALGQKKCDRTEKVWPDRKSVKKCDQTEKVWPDRKSVTWRTDRQTDRRTDGQTDGRTDGRTDRQATEKWSLSVTSAYSRWHKNVVLDVGPHLVFSLLATVQNTDTIPTKMGLIPWYSEI